MLLVGRTASVQVAKRAPAVTRFNRSSRSADGEVESRIRLKREIWQEIRGMVSLRTKEAQYVMRKNGMNCCKEKNRRVL